MNMLMKAAKSDHSTHDGMYDAAVIGRRGLERLGTTMRKRSSHIPISTDSDASTVPHTFVRVRVFASSVNGTMKQVMTIVQKSGENFPSVLERKITMCIGSPP